MHQSDFKIFIKGFILFILYLSFFYSSAQLPVSFDLVKRKAILYDSNGKKGLIAGKKILLPALYDSILPLKKHFVKVYNAGKCGVYETGEKQVVPCLYDGLTLVNDTLLLSDLNNKVGLLTLTNRILLDPVHKAVIVNAYGNTIVENFKKFKIVFGDEVAEVEADSVVEETYNYLVCYNNRIEKIRKRIDSVSIQRDFVMERLPVEEPIVMFGDKVYGAFSCDTLFKGLFESARYQDSLLIYKNGPKYGLANILPSILTEPSYDTIEWLSRKYLKFQKNGLWGIMDRSGRILTDTLYDCLQEVSSHHYCKVTLGGLEGLIGYNGRVIIPPLYSTFQRDSSENIFTFFCKSKYLAIVDTTGIQLLDTNYRYQEIGLFQNGFAKVKKNDKYGFINKRGGLTIATQYLKVCDKVVSERASVMIKGKWALVDSWEKMLAQPYYDSIGFYCDSVAIAVKNKKYLLLSYYGKELCSAKFEMIKRFDTHNYLVRSGGKFGVMRKDGDEIVFTKYDQIVDIDKYFIVVKSFGKYGVLAYNGKEIASVEYDGAFLSKNDKAYVLVKNIGRSIVKF